MRFPFFRRPPRPTATLPGHESTHSRVPWIEVSSSNLVRVAYFPRARKLAVVFHHGRAYLYSGVPAGVWNSLLASPSHGVYHGAYIKNAYPYSGPTSQAALEQSVRNLT